MVRIAVLVSGGGTNLQALIDAQSRGELKNGRIAAVLSSRPDAYALERAARAGIPGYVVARKDFASNREMTIALVDKLRELNIGLVVLAGFSVGLVDESDMIDGSTLCEGDLLIGLCSNGVHSNGFSLVRKVLLDNPKALDIYVSELGRTIGEELLRPTHIYVKSIQCLRQHGVTVKAISHITGGGLYENVPRMMKEGLTARIRTSSYPVPAIFELIQKSGDIPVRDMYNTFNMGIGLVIAIPKDQVGHALDVLARAGEQSYVIGDVIKGDAGVELV